MFCFKKLKFNIINMLIGIIGGKRHGKDSIANYLKLKYNYETYAYAKPLKEICKLLFHLSHEQLYGTLKEVVDPRWNTTPRILLQSVGTDLFREQLSKVIPELNTNNIWIKHFELWYKNNKMNDVVVADVRFEDEIYAIKSNGGKIIHVIRDLDIVDEHISEQIHKTYKADYVISNNGTLENLYNKVDKMIEDLSH